MRINKFHHYLKWILLSFIVGLLAGTSAFIFLKSLEYVTSLHTQNNSLIWFLPLAGLISGLLYSYAGKNSEKGTHLILEEIHNPKSILPFRMAPLILFATILTHLFGGSAGREGTAVQLGASLADQLSRFFKVSSDERKNLLIAGIGAGFSAAIGAPLAGVIFGMEVIHIGKIKFNAVIESLVSSYTAYHFAIFLGTTHLSFSPIPVPEISFKWILVVCAAGILFGLAARFFIGLTYFIEKQLLFIKFSPLRTFLMGGLLAILYYFEGSYRYNGLGLPLINGFFSNNSHTLDPFFKTLFTALTVGSGFKGGEFIPLVYIGASLGNILAQIFSLSLPALTALGFVSVFAGAANTPLACAILALELFGLHIGLWAIITCYLSFYFSGYYGIYKNQKLLQRIKYGKYHT